MKSINDFKAAVVKNPSIIVSTAKQEQIKGRGDDQPESNGIIGTDDLIFH